MIKEILFLILIWEFFVLIIPMLTLREFSKIKRIQKTKFILKTANKLKKKTPEETLKTCFNYVIKNYSGKEKRWGLINFIKWFYRDTEYILRRKMFLPCHVQNLVLVTLLINTGKFNINQIEQKETVTKFGTYHHYLIIKINNQKYFVDPFFKELRKFK